MAINMNQLRFSVLNLLQTPLDGDRYPVQVETCYGER
jgi:hypothetical protein